MSYREIDRPPTVEQLDQALRLPPGTITFERPAGPPRADDPYRILASVEPAGDGSWRVRLEPAWP